MLGKLSPRRRAGPTQMGSGALGPSRRRPLVVPCCPSPKEFAKAHAPLQPTAMENETQQPTIRIVLDENVAQGEYVNFANIIHSQSEFVIDLGRVVPGRNDVKIYSRVIMT